MAHYSITNSMVSLNNKYQTYLYNTLLVYRVYGT